MATQDILAQLLRSQCIVTDSKSGNL